MLHADDSKQPVPHAHRRSSPTSSSSCEIRPGRPSSVDQSTHLNQSTRLLPPLSSSSPAQNTTANAANGSLVSSEPSRCTTPSWSSSIMDVLPGMPASSGIGMKGSQRMNGSGRLLHSSSSGSASLRSNTVGQPSEISSRSRTIAKADVRRGGYASLRFETRREINGDANEVPEATRSGPQNDAEQVWDLPPKGRTVPPEFSTPSSRTKLLADYVKSATPTGEDLRLDLLHPETQELIDGHVEGYWQDKFVKAAYLEGVAAKKRAGRRRRRANKKLQEDKDREYYRSQSDKRNEQNGDVKSPRGSAYDRNY